jgi:hypothetical protein
MWKLHGRHDGDRFPVKTPTLGIRAGMLRPGWVQITSSSPGTWVSVSTFSGVVVAVRGRLKNWQVPAMASRV